MKDFWIKNRKLIMIIVASLLLVMNISIILFSKISQDMRKSVSEIFGESKILDINFCNVYNGNCNEYLWEVI